MNEKYFKPIILMQEDIQKKEKENFELRQTISDLEKQIDVERWQGLAYWENFKKLKKFALYFKRDIEEGLKGNYKKGENIVYDNLLNEFGKSFLNELLQEVLNEKEDE